MTSLRELKTDDLFKLNALVFDPFTEVYHLSFYLRHLAQWPDLAMATTAPNDKLTGLIFGKCLDGFKDDTPVHGYVCSLTVSEFYRRLGIASLLMNNFSEMLDLKHAWYVELYMRCSNQAAFNLYNRLGFTLRRVLLDYYPGVPEEDAYDMRKPLTIDEHGVSLSNASREPVCLPLDDDSDDGY